MLKTKFWVEVVGKESEGKLHRRVYEVPCSNEKEAREAARKVLEAKNEPQGSRSRISSIPPAPNERPRIFDFVKTDRGILPIVQ